MRVLNTGISRNGIGVYVQKWESHKLPVLCVKVENDNCLYKVASFNSVETAEWFTEVMEEFFSPLIGKTIQEDEQDG